MATNLMCSEMPKESGKLSPNFNIFVKTSSMKVLLEIKPNRLSFFMELIKSLDFVNVVKAMDDERNNQFVSDLAEAFHDVKLHEQGKKKLKSAKDLLNEL
jgi:hypothetical protein